MSQQKIAYLDYLRVFSIFAVICIHVTAPSLPMKISDEGWQINVAFNSAARFGVPLFFMISGALFLNENRIVSFEYLWSKIRRIILAFLFFSLAYNILWYVATFGFRIEKDIILHKFIPNLIGGWYHLWYLQALLTLYILTPILKLIVKDKKVTRYAIFLIFLIGSFFPFVGNWGDYQLYTSNLKENMAFNLPKYSLYFLLGFYLSTFTPKISNKSIGIIGILMLMIMIALDIYVSNIKNSVSIISSAYMSPFTIVYTSCIFLYVKNKIRKSNIPNVVKIVSSLSFGVYLVHDFFLIIARELNLIPFKYNTLFMIPLMVIMVLVFSSILTFILKKLPIIKSIV